MAERVVTIVHTSDVHVDQPFGPPTLEGAADLAAVIATAKALGADVLLLCGDTFERHNLPMPLIEHATALLADAGRPVVILPGNHDPDIEAAVWRRCNMLAIPDLHILGANAGERVLFPALDLEVWGRPHRDYGDMVPFERVPPRRARWRVAMGHGHYDPAADRSQRPRASWLIDDDEIVAAEADYVALGHWNRAIEVGARARAHYSGSPDYAETVNVVRLSDLGVVVERAPLTRTG